MRDGRCQQTSDHARSGLNFPVKVKDLRVAIAGAIYANDGRVENAARAADMGSDFDFERTARDIREALNLANEFEAHAGDATQLINAAIGSGQAAAVVLPAPSAANCFGTEWVHTRDQLKHRRRGGVDVDLAG